MRTNRKIRRLVALFALVIFSMTSLIFNPGLQTIAQGKKTVIVHYAKAPGAAQDWNLWMWPFKEEGKAYPFTDKDEFGQIAKVTFDTDTNKIGFIVRTDDWQKDIGEDRFITNFDANGTAEVWLKGGDAKIYTSKPAPSEATVSKMNETTQVTVHYKRYDNKYEGWNLWVWPEGAEGAAYQFEGQDSFGKVARFVVSGTKDLSKLGFIVRQSESGNDWKAKDIGEDRAVSSFKKDGSTEIWLVQGDAKVYYSEDEVDTTPEILSATLEEFTGINVGLKAPMAYSKTGDNGFIVTSASGKNLKVKEVKKLDDIGTDIGMNFMLILDTSADLNESLKVSKAGYQPVDVILGQVMGTKEFNNSFYYDKNDLGNTYSKDKTSFKLWAPTAAVAKVIVYEKADDKAGTETAMTKGEKGVWTAEIQGNLEGKFYTYSVKVGENWNEAVDPYVRSVAVNGDKGAIIDLSKTNPKDWKPNKKPDFNNASDAVIYELHVRDLSIQAEGNMKNKGKYLALTEKGTKDANGNPTGLDYIKNLGVTHVQLLPVFDFASIDERKTENAFNWGYDPKNYNAPEGSYSTDPSNPYSRVTELKQAVQSLHDNGIRVVMDVVYNHVFNADAHSFNKLVPGYYFRYNPDGTYSNGSGCGNDVASERAMVSKYIVDSVVYWAKEYNLDGFRFDLMGLLDIDTMNTVRAELNKIDPSIIVIGEGWNMTTRLQDSKKASQRNASRLPNIAHFNDTIRDGLKGSVFNKTQAGFANGNINSIKDVKKGIVGAITYSGVLASWGDVDPVQSVSYVEAHDNNTLWDKLLFTNPKDSDSDRKAMHRLASSIALTSQGVAFIHAGQEFLRTKGGNENSYNLPDSVNRLDWTRAAANKDNVEYFKGLIQLRKEHPAFRMTTAEAVIQNLKFLDAPDKVISYNLGNNANGDKWENIFLAFNANKEEKIVKLPSSGTWHIVVNKDQAGTKTIKTIKGDTVTVPALSTMVLYSGVSQPVGVGLYIAIGVLLAAAAAFFVIKKSNLKLFRK